MQLPPQVEKALEHVDAFMLKYPSLTQYEKMKQLEEKFKLPKAIFFTGISTIFMMITYVVGGAKLISDLFGFFYPAYMSFKAIDSPDTDDNVQWLTYWVVFSLFSILEQTCGFITAFIPFYFYLKIAFFVYLYHPTTMGAQMVYTQVVRPMLLPYLEMSKPEKKAA